MPPSSNPRFLNRNPDMRDLQWANITPDVPSNNEIPSNYPPSRAAHFMETVRMITPRRLHHLQLI